VSEALLVRCLKAWATVHRDFRVAAVKIERSIRTAPISITSSCKSYLQRGYDDVPDSEVIELSISLDRDIGARLSEERFSHGVSMVLEHRPTKWRVSGEVGWSCRTSGWDSDLDEEFEATDAQAAIDSIAEIARRLLERYKELAMASYTVPSDLPSDVSPPPSRTDSGEEEAVPSEVSAPPVATDSGEEEA
jgi:hypothetical protein